MEAIVYGNQDLYVSIFNSIAILMGTNAFGSLIRLVLGIGLVMAVLSSAFSLNPMTMMRWFLTAAIIYGTMFLPKTTVHIADKFGSGAPVAVANVPVALAFLFSVSTRTGDRATELMETSFGDPAIADYSENGMIYASRLMTELNDTRIVNESQAALVRSFINNCVKYELLEGRYTFSDLIDAENLLEYITVTMPPNPARTGVWGEGAGAPVRTCADMATDLPGVLSAAVPRSAELLGRRVSNGFANSITAAAIQADIGGAHTLLIGASRDSTEIFTQAMLGNAVRDGFTLAPAESGGDISAYALTRAELQMQNQNFFSAELSQKWIPYLKIVLEIIFYSMFPLLAPFFLLPQMGLSLLKQYFAGFVMLQSWGPLYVILNKIMIHSAISDSHLAAATESGAPALSLANLANVASANADLASVAGYMTMLIPVIAMSLAYGAHRLASQSESLLSSVNSGAAEAARDETVGNANLGTTGYDLHRFQQNFGNQESTSFTSDTGRAAIRSSEGGTVNFTANGSEFYDGTGARSNLGLPISSSQMVGAELRESSGELRNYSEQQSERAGQSYAQASDALTSWGLNSSSGLSATLSDRFSSNADVREALSTIDEMHRASSRQLSSDVHDTRTVDMSASATAFGEASTGAGLPGGIGPQGRVGVRAEATARTGQNDAETTRATFLESLNASEREQYDSAVSTVLSAMSSSDLSQMSSENASYANTVQEAMRSSESYSTEAARTMSLSEQASDMASRYESESFRYDRPLDDQLLAFYGSQIDSGTGQRIDSVAGWQGGLMEMYHQNPEEFDQLVGSFSSSLVPGMAHWDAAGSGISGGGDLERLSSSIGEGRELGSAAAGEISGSRETLSRAETGISEGHAEELRSDMGRVTDQVGAPSEGAPGGAIPQPDSYRDMRGVIDATRRERDNSGEVDPERQDEGQRARDDFLMKGPRPIEFDQSTGAASSPAPQDDGPDEDPNTQAFLQRFSGRSL